MTDEAVSRECGTALIFPGAFSDRLTDFVFRRMTMGPDGRVGNEAGFRRTGGICWECPEKNKTSRRRGDVGRYDTGDCLAYETTAPEG